MKNAIVRMPKNIRYVVLGVMLITGSIIYSVYLDNRNNGADKMGPVITFSTDMPEEKVPEETGYSWRGRSNDPMRIVIPKIGVNAYVQNVGVDQNQQIAVPNNIHIAGWFVDTVQPGEQGLSIIDGHVNGPTSDEGVFHRLKELAIDDEIRIVQGNGIERPFKVRITQSVPTEETATLLYSQDPSIQRQLTLITCTGRYNSETRSYDQRQIVILEAK